MLNLSCIGWSTFHDRSAISIALENFSTRDQFSQTYVDFIKIVKFLIYSAIPSAMVSMPERDPPFITPPIKVLLCQRPKVRICDKVQEADVMRNKFNKLIERNRSKQLANASSQDIEKMWCMVKASGSWSR